MARVVCFHQTGGPEVLRIEEVEVPPPGKGGVQIRIHALGLRRTCSRSGDRPSLANARAGRRTAFHVPTAFRIGCGETTGGPP